MYTQTEVLCLTAMGKASKSECCLLDVEEHQSKHPRRLDSRNLDGDANANMHDCLSLLSLLGHVPKDLQSPQ